MKNNDIKLTPIGYIESPYREKFAIPRQPGLVPSAKGRIILEPPYNEVDMVRGLENFSHLWVIFNFHATQQQGWKSLVRPPRLGGNKKMGVLATRSTFRPNPIGMSVVKLDRIITANKKIEIHISALDLLHKTPIIDIKPYIAYSDSIPSCESGYATTSPDKKISIKFSPNVIQQIITIEKKSSNYSNLLQLIKEVLQQDPRPAYKKKTLDDRVYGMKLYDMNIRWHFIGIEEVYVISIENIT